jgi:hypothetical protein
MKIEDGYLFVWKVVRWGKRGRQMYLHTALPDGK